MKNNPLYKQLEQIALDENRTELSTIEQVQAMDSETVKVLVGGGSGFSLDPNFLNNVKRGIIETLQTKATKEKLEQLKKNLSQEDLGFLKDNYPEFKQDVEGKETDGG